MEVLNQETFKAKIFNYEATKVWSFAGARPAIIDFYADWCGPCQALIPVLDEVANKYAGQIDFYKVDTDATPELAALFEVRGIPALLFVPMTGEPAMASGFMQADSFDRAISDIFGIGAKH